MEILDLRCMNCGVYFRIKLMDETPFRCPCCQEAELTYATEEQKQKLKGGE